MEALVRDFTDPGDLVLDGTRDRDDGCRRDPSRPAVRRVGAFGEKYHETATTRLAGTAPQLELAPRTAKPKQVALIPKKGFPMLPAPEGGA
jgi:hypothetical protein